MAHDDIFLPQDLGLQLGRETPEWRRQLTMSSVVDGAAEVVNKRILMPH